MNTLKQQKSFLVGSDSDIRELAGKKEVSILVISDSHGQKPLVRKLFQDFGTECDAAVFCGDGVSDVLEALDTAYHDKAFASAVPPVVAFVQGNGDANRYPVEFQPSDKDEATSRYHDISIPKRVTFTAAGHRLLVVHGHHEGVYYGTGMLEDESKQAGAEIALYGHSHIAKEERRNGQYLLNPGSCFRPRGGQPPSIAVMTLSAASSTIETVFYEISIRLEKGLSYMPYLPQPIPLW